VVSEVVVSLHILLLFSHHNYNYFCHYVYHLQVHLQHIVYVVMLVYRYAEILRFHHTRSTLASHHNPHYVVLPVCHHNPKTLFSINMNNAICKLYSKEKIGLHQSEFLSYYIKKYNNIKILIKISFFYLS